MDDVRRKKYQQSEEDNGLLMATEGEEGIKNERMKER